MNDDAMRLAARRALELVEDGMLLGLGTGSTARVFVEMLAQHLAGGRLRHLRCVATSFDTGRLAYGLGIPMVSLNAHPQLDMAVDGADELTTQCDLLKGGGGALMREKIVALAARRLVIIAHRSKLVECLASTHPVPIEVLPFGWRCHEPFLRELGARPILRRYQPDGPPFQTDNGHYVIDLHFSDGLAQPAELAAALERRPGVLEHGLFLGLAESCIVADHREVTVLRAT